MASPTIRISDVTYKSLQRGGAAEGQRVEGLRISDVTYKSLQRLAQARDETTGQIVAEAVDRYEREEALASLNAAYARLAADPAAADGQAELKALDDTLLDGVADDPWVE